MPVCICKMEKGGGRERDGERKRETAADIDGDRGTEMEKERED